MSRSKKHTPFTSIASGSGQKKFRSQENRAKRRLTKTRLLQERYDEMPQEKAYGNEWASPRDGKTWFGYIKASKPWYTGVLDYDDPRDPFFDDWQKYLRK